MAYPRKMTPENIAIIAAKLREGKPIDVAAAQAGVHPRTVHKWRARDPEANDQLLMAILQGEGELIDAARTGDNDAKWMLERRWPRRWSQRLVLHMQQEATVLVEILESELPPEQLARVLDRITAHELGLSPPEDQVAERAVLPGHSGPRGAGETES